VACAWVGPLQRAAAAREAMRKAMRKAAKKSPRKRETARQNLLKEQKTTTLKSRKAAGNKESRRTVAGKAPRKTTGGKTVIDGRVGKKTPAKNKPCEKKFGPKPVARQRGDKRQGRYKPGGELYRGR